MVGAEDGEPSLELLVESPHDFSGVEKYENGAEKEFYPQDDDKDGDKRRGQRVSPLDRPSLGEEREVTSPGTSSLCVGIFPSSAPRL